MKKDKKSGKHDRGHYNNTKKTNRKKSTKSKQAEEDQPVINSEYLKMATEKKNHNKKKLQDLGLVNKNPSPRMDTSPKKKGTPKAKGKDGSPRTRRRVMQTPTKKGKEEQY